ncbi:MAG TPA: MmgE/PrpD family protein [Candidatus Binatia bacterium]|nr:MmgE/PrpD family protein [Candidatus Binatia bacterium]
MVATNVTGQLAKYMAEARRQSLTPEIAQAGKHRILDSLGAIVSGSRLKAGELAILYVRLQGGAPEASVLATDVKTSAVNAALANGMFGHADETDDFEPVTKAHPGCSVVPAALAMAEREGSSGEELLRAVVLGYDLCCRFLMALGPELVRGGHRSAEGTSSTMGSAAAAASLAKLDETGMRFALSYAAQQVSGIWSWVRDSEHVEKAFDFAGMGARNGVTAAIMVQTGFTGVWDVFEGEHNVLEALSPSPSPSEMVKDLGSHFFVAETAIKPYPVGYPIQSALDAFFALYRQHGLKVENVERIIVRLPEDGARIVNNRSMPDVNCQHMIAMALVDGKVTFDSTRSYERMRDPAVLAVKERVNLVADPALMDPKAPRSAKVEVVLKEGRTLNHFTRHAYGTKQNPMETTSVNAKARELLEPVLGQSRTEAIIQRVNGLERVAKVQELLPFLTLKPEEMSGVSPTQ